MPLEVDAIGTEAFTTRFRRTSSIVHEELRIASERSRMMLEHSAKEFAPVKTGALKSDIFAEVDYSRFPSRFTISIGAHDPASAYAVFVAKGTGIYHKPNPHAPWYQERGGLHRGQRPQDFVDRSVTANRQRVRAEIRAAGERIRLRLETSG